jgi:hypothetical protein
MESNRQKFFRLLRALALLLVALHIILLLSPALSAVDQFKIARVVDEDFIKRKYQTLERHSCKLNALKPKFSPIDEVG